MFVASPGFVARGAVNVISLEELKEAARERWPRLQVGVYARLEALLRGMLGPADFFAQINDTAYLIAMPTSAPEDVNLICLRAAYELHNSMLGDCRIDQLAVGTATPGGGHGELTVQPIPLPQLAALAAKQNQTAAPPEYARDLAVRHQFLPIWSVPNAAITTYLCEPKSITAPHRRDSIPLQALDPAERLAVEMSCFQHGIDVLARDTTAGKQFILAVGLSCEMLGSPAGRESVLAILRNQPRELRSYLAFVVHQVPHGVAQTKLGTLVNLLRPFGRSVSVTLAPHSHLFRAHQDIGITNIGFAVSEFGTQPPNQHEIEELALFARRNRMGTFVSHINNINTLKFAQDAGIQQLSGPAVAVTCQEPRGVWRLTWQQLLSEQVVEIWG
jgi:hypothetical protein